MKSSVKIGPSFFANELNDYENWRWAFVREAMQNSVDAKGTDTIRISVKEEDGQTVFSWSNNGSPMTEDILVNKLFALGESGKRFQGAVGGFGKAKILLYFTHDSYVIKTGNMLVDGSGADYEISESEYLHGTESTVTINGHHKDVFMREIAKFTSLLQWDGQIIVDHGDRQQTLKCNHPKGTRRRDIEFGVIYTNKSDSNICVVRIGGIPMFYQYCGIDRMVVVELNGRSIDVLTSNRDGLLFPHNGRLSNFITELSTDKRKALKETTTQYERYAGAKLGHRNSVTTGGSERSEEKTSLIGSIVLGGISGNAGGATAGVNYRSMVADTHTEVETDADSGIDAQTAAALTVVDGDDDAMLAYSLTEPGDKGASRLPVRHVRMNQEFIIKNESGLTVPDYYRPSSPEFSDYSRKLVRMWGRLMLEMHRLFKHEDDFAIGFIFDEDTVAEHEKSSHYGRVYYISPSKIVEQVYSKSKSFKKRWKLDNAGKKRMLSVAAHEFVHGLGYSYHSDEFASRYTDVMGTVMANMSRFTWCYRS
jgi:hypothetical protein